MKVDETDVTMFRLMNKQSKRDRREGTIFDVPRNRKSLSTHIMFLVWARSPRSRNRTSGGITSVTFCHRLPPSATLPAPITFFLFHRFFFLTSYQPLCLIRRCGLRACQGFDKTLWRPTHQLVCSPSSRWRCNTTAAVLSEPSKRQSSEISLSKEERLVFLERLGARRTDQVCESHASSPVLLFLRLPTLPSSLLAQGEEARSLFC